MSHVARATQRGYVERLHPPLWWWLVAAGMWGSVSLAVWAYLGPWWAALATAAVMVGTGALIVQQALTIRVDAGGLRVGRNLLEWPWAASARALDAATTTEYLRSSRHHDDFFAVRPYATRALIVALRDPADPHPNWVISTNRPESLAAAIAAHGVTSGGRDG